MEHGTITVKMIRSRFQEELAGMYPEQEIRQFLTILFEEWLGWPKTRIHLESDHRLKGEEVALFTNALDDLRNYTPIQYIIGVTGFLGLKIKVRTGVLIPRPETEELAMLIIHDARHLTGRNTTVLDIGTGSGCLALGIKKNLPETEVNACDISSVALEIAKQNGLENGCDIHFFQADILDKKNWRNFGNYNIIVSNPPYIPESDRATMNRNVTGYEPSEALFVPDQDPLKFYKAIGSFAKEHLASPGTLYFEIHELFGEEIRKLLLNTGFAEVIIHKDLNGKDRFITANP